MLIQHLTERYRTGPQEILEEIDLLKSSRDKLLLNNLVVSLRSRPIRWISGFIDFGGLSVLLDYLNDAAISNCHDEYEELYIKCLKSLMNNKIGLSGVLDTDGALKIIALSLRSPSLVTRSLVFEIFGAVCLISGGHSQILESMDFLCEHECGRFRFETVMYSLWESCKGVSSLEKELQVASMSFINAIICGGPGEDIEFRMHMRWEFIHLGLVQFADVFPIDLENGID